MVKFVRCFKQEKNSRSDIFVAIIEAILFIFLRGLVTNPLFI
ncbi:MAG: hypothetical protein PX636_21670 [Microcystis sp. M53598_WE2]|nr:hypothetical protein [Microcystis sp. M53598_WE2]